MPLVVVPAFLGPMPHSGEGRCEARGGPVVLVAAIQSPDSSLVGTCLGHLIHLVCPLDLPDYHWELEREIVASSVLLFGLLFPSGFYRNFFHAALGSL